MGIETHTGRGDSSSLDCCGHCCGYCGFYNGIFENGTHLVNRSSLEGRVGPVSRSGIDHSRVQHNSRSLLLDTSSPQYRAVQWLSEDDGFTLDFTSYDHELVIQRYSLAVIYFATAGGIGPMNTYSCQERPNMTGRPLQTMV